MKKRIAKRYLVGGRVQGVGFRNFVQGVAAKLKLDGYARNLDDGRVEVCAAGTGSQLSELAGWLRQGPRWAEVRSVEEIETAMLNYEGFHILH